MDSPEHRIAAGVAAANIPTLLVVLVQLTGETRWLEPPYQVRRAYGVDDNDSGGLDDEAQRQVRGAAAAAIADWMRTGHIAIPKPGAALAARMMAAAMGQKVPDEYGPMVADDVDLCARAAVCAEPLHPVVPDGFRVLV